jgi:hypothetical protein
MGVNTTILRKTDKDRIIPYAEPKPVVVERIMPDVPTEEPVVDASRLRRIRSSPNRVWHHEKSSRRATGDICRRHGKRKVTTRGGRSWRCR